MKRFASFGLVLSLAASGQPEANARAKQRIVEGPLPTPATEIGRLASLRFRTFYCGDVGYVDTGSVADRPAYYFLRGSGRVLAICGGACMGDAARCRRECPPRAWTCGRLPPQAFVPRNRRQR